MPQSIIFRTIELDGQYLRTAVRPGSSSLPPLLIFNGIGANLELVFPGPTEKPRTYPAPPVEAVAFR